MKRQKRRALRIALPPQPRQRANGRDLKRPYEKTDAAMIAP